MAVAQYYGTGRRKTSVARVRLVPGQGNITVNKKELNEYFGRKTLELVIKQPLVLTGVTEQYDVIADVKGGGPSGQAGAIRHGISRALLEVDSDFRQALKKLVSSRVTRVKKNAANTASRKLVKLLSSRNVNIFPRYFRQTYAIKKGYLTMDFHSGTPFLYLFEGKPLVDRKGPGTWCGAFLA